MVVEWQAKEQKEPLCIKFGMAKDTFLAMKTSEIDAAKVTKKIVLSDQQIEDTGQLFFSVTNREGAMLLWAHLTNEKFVKEIKYPSGSKVEEPEKPEVTVFKSPTKIVIDVDGIQYAFMADNVADPLIKTLEDPKAMVIGLIEDMANRPDMKVSD